MTSSSPEPVGRPEAEPLAVVWAAVRPAPAGGTTPVSSVTGQDSRVMDAATAAARAVPSRELRSGSWTRLGGETVLGDAVTEHTLTALATAAEAAARAQGYSAGWAEGRRAAEQQGAELVRELTAGHVAEEGRREGEHRRALASLHQAAARLDAAVLEVCARVEARTSEVAAELTAVLLDAELRLAETPGLDAVRRALALAPGEPVVRIRLSPGDAADPALADLAGPVAHAAVITDPTLRPGDAVIETAEGVVDARVSAAMSRVREALLS